MQHIKEILEKSRQDIPAQKSYKKPILFYEEPEESPEEKRAYNLKGLGIMDLNHDFKTMRRVTGIILAMDACKALCSGNADYHLLMIYGGVGNGKTRLCEAVVIELYDKGVWVSRDRWSDVVRTMKSHFNNRGNIPYEEYFAHLRSRARLIFDDVGSGSTLGSWEWGELEDIVDYRYERNLFTIITTNLDIKSFNKRILSRFRDKSKASLILNEASDYRPLIGCKDG